MYLTTRNDSYFPYELFREFFGEETPNIMKSDVYLDGEQYAIDVELPGVKKEDIEINYEREYLTVTVSFKEEKNEKKYALRERNYRNSSRSYHVGEVDKNTIKADFENGILKIRIPKEQPKIEAAHRININ